MNYAALALLASDALYLALRVAAPAILACIVAGLLVGFFQASTQSHDASVGFVPKLVAVAVALLLCRAFMGAQLVHFSTQVYQYVAQVAR